LAIGLLKERQAMTYTDRFRIEVNPKVTPEKLFSFYKRNNICETGYGKEKASKVLEYSSLIVAAFEGDELVGIARAMFDGLAAAIMEFCVAIKYQGDNLRYNNGSLKEKDSLGLGRELGRVLIDELVNMGATFITEYVVENCEEGFYKSLGFEHNTGHLVYYIDRRPYVTKGSL
jgi:hypothetical protein